MIDPAQAAARIYRHGHDSEKVIERHLVRLAKAAGGVAIKLIDRGLPDRLLLFPGGKIVFVETKSRGCKPRPIQQAAIKMLRDLGFTVCVSDSKEVNNQIIADVCQSDCATPRENVKT